MTSEKLTIRNLQIECGYSVFEIMALNEDDWHAKRKWLTQEIKKINEFLANFDLSVHKASLLLEPNNIHNYDNRNDGDASDVDYVVELMMNIAEHYSVHDSEFEAMTGVLKMDIDNVIKLKKKLMHMALYYQLL